MKLRNRLTALRGTGNPALRYSAAYFLVISLLWAGFPEQLLDLLAGEYELSHLQLFKELAFSGLSALLLFFLVKAAYAEGARHRQAVTGMGASSIHHHARLAARRKAKEPVKNSGIPELAGDKPSDVRLARLTRRLINRQEAERKRLAIQLHDRTSANLAAIGLNLNLISMAGTAVISPEIAKQLEDIRALVEDTSVSISEITSDLRPALLDYAGLVPALEGYVRQFSKRTGTKVRFDHFNFTHRLEPALEALLYRITLEALANCAKHASATAIDVILIDDQGTILLTISDNGNGLDPAAPTMNDEDDEAGELNMREMVELAGGQLTIDSSPGIGTAIHIAI